MRIVTSLALLALTLVSQLALAQSITVEGAQVRAVPPVSTTSAAFMVLRNADDEEIALSGAASPAAEVLEIHLHESADGVMQMRRIPEVTIPAGSHAELAPGGLHLMMIGLTRPLAEGDEVAITLYFDNGETLEVAAPVQPVEARGSQSHGEAH